MKADVSQVSCFSRDTAVCKQKLRMTNLGHSIHSGQKMFFFSLFFLRVAIFLIFTDFISELPSSSFLINCDSRAERAHFSRLS